MRVLLSLLSVAVLSGCAGGRDPALSISDPTLVSVYEAAEQAMRGDRYLRLERAPADVPFDQDDLARNFMTIAFNTEADILQPNGGNDAKPTPMLRWSESLSYIVDGSGVTTEDREALAAIAARVASATGLRIEEVDDIKEADLSILFIGPLERGILRSTVARSAVANDNVAILRWPDVIASPCMGRIGADENYVIRSGLIVIRSEVRDTLRRSCIEEEFVQTMGLTNDSSDVRPSIFNDNQEFALLTDHDELLLRALYDERLSAGMSAEEARPIVDIIMRDLRPSSGAPLEETLP